MSVYGAVVWMAVEDGAGGVRVIQLADKFVTTGKHFHVFLHGLCQHENNVVHYILVTAFPMFTLECLL